MTRTATVLLGCAIGLGVAHAAEKPDTVKSQPPAAKEKPANTDSESRNALERELKKPVIELPGGMKGTLGTIDAPKDPFRPGYTGPNSDSGPSLPAGGLILKKEF